MERRSRYGWIEMVGAAVLAGVLTGCGGGPEPTGGAPSPSAAPGGGTVRLTGAGATFPTPLYSKWFAAYHTAHPDVEVNYQSIGSGGGIQQLKARTVDFGASDAPLSDEERKEMPRPVVHVPTAAGAVVLAYQLSGAPADLKLTPEAVAGIFLGSIKTWNDPVIAAANAGAALPATPIAVAHRSDGSGTTFIFTSYLSAVSPEWKSRVGAGKSVQWPVGLGGKGNEGVTSLVQQTPGAIGYVELAYARQNNLQVASLRNRAGDFVKPSVESTTAAAAGAAEALARDVRSLIVDSPAPGAYPIAGMTYILVYESPADAQRGQAVAKLLAWCMDEGQKMAAELDYAPLPEGVLKLNREALSGLGD